MNDVEIGAKVKLKSGAPAVVEGIGEVLRTSENGLATAAESESVTVYEIETTGKGHVDRFDRVTLPGERFLLYRAGFDLDNEFVVEVAYRFKSVVKAESEEEAIEALRDALVSVLTWDGDDNAPEALVALEMRGIEVPK